MFETSQETGLQSFICILVNRLALREACVFGKIFLLLVVIYFYLNLLQECGSGKFMTVLHPLSVLRAHIGDIFRVINNND